MDYVKFVSLVNEQLCQKDQTYAPFMYERLTKSVDEAIAGGESLEARATMENIMQKVSSGHEKSVFYKTKAYLKIYYQLLYEDGKVGKDALETLSSISFNQIGIEDTLERFYFRNLDEVLNYVELYARSVGLATTDYYNLESIIILAWHGYSVQEIINYRKTDVATFVGSRREKEILDYHAAVDGFSTTSGHVLRYVDSEYLIRSHMAPKLGVNALHCTFHNFNKVAGKLGKELKYLHLAKNGKYCAIAEVEKNRDLNSAIKSIFDCDNPSVFSHKKGYLAWKNLYEIKTMQEIVHEHQ